jgi:hypothetical protein
MCWKRTRGYGELALGGPAADGTVGVACGRVQALDSPTKLRGCGK